MDTAVITPDQVSLGVLVTAVPRDAVEDAIAMCGVGAQRSDGKLPPHVTAYLTLALCLFPEDDYREVATKVTGALDRWGCWDANWSVPMTSAITQARKRLGHEVFPEIFARVAGPVAGQSSPVASRVDAALATGGRTRGAWLREWRVLAIDGFDVDLPDTDENAAEFGYAPADTGHSAYPKARVVALTECGTHAVLAAQVGAYRTGEHTLASHLLSGLRPGELLTADRNFYSFQAWTTAADTGADLVWRAPTPLGLPVIRVLPDGSYLSVLISPKRRRRDQRQALLDAARAGTSWTRSWCGWVRVVEYDVPDRAGSGTGELITLLTTILDPDQASVEELADVYHQRWEQETGHDQLKTHLRGPGRVLRSRLPVLVHQEIWAWLIVHDALARLITQAADAVDLDPDRISFTQTLRLVRRSATGTADILPGDWAEALPRILAVIGRLWIPARRHRSCPRTVKRAWHNGYRVKRPGQAASVRYPGPATIRFYRVTPRPT